MQWKARVLKEKQMAQEEREKSLSLEAAVKELRVSVEQEKSKFISEKQKHGT